MGADIGKDCSCSGLCAPEDPGANDPPYDAKRNGFPHTTAEHGHAVPSTPNPSPATSGVSVTHSVAIYGSGEEEQETFFIPPPEPDPDSRGPSARGAPAPPPAPASAPAPASTPAPARTAPSGGTARKAPTFQQVLSDLESTEIYTYGSAFADLAGGQEGLQPDHTGLRDFLMTNSAISAADIDTELLKIASQRDSFSIDCDGLLTLLRENSISEGDALQQFLTLSSNGESITGEDCRSGLLHLVEEKLGSRLPGAQTERIFDTAMVDVGLSVSMEQWIHCSKRVARTIRLMRFAGVSS